MFEGSSSSVLELTLAVFVIVPERPRSTVTSIVYDAEPPLGMVPKVQVGTPVGSSTIQPVVDTKVTSAGRVSVTTTSCAGSGPQLVTVTV